MVNTGRPSRGCDVCRRRRIKCDEAYPSCGYCVRRNIPCPGAKPQFDVAWRDQNTVAERSVQRRQNAAESAERQRENNQLAVVSNRVPRVLPQDQAGYADNFFFSYYICLPEDSDVQHGFMECLYPIWLKSDVSSPLRPIVTAVASVMLDAWSLKKPDQPASLSRSQWAKGVASLRTTLESADPASDETVMATLMLDMYESLLGFLTSRNNVGLHISGATALIESRKTKPMPEKVTQRMIMGTRNQVIGRAITKAQPLPAAVSTWSQAAIDIPTVPSFRLDDLGIELANLQVLASRFADDDSIGPDAVSSFLQKAIELDQGFTNWYDDLPPHWPPVRVSGLECIPQSVRDAGLYQDHCDVYKSLFVAKTFNQFYLSRIRLQIIIARCHERLDSGRPAIADVMIIVQDLADTMCACIPFFLGDRNTAGRVDDRTVRFPSIVGRRISDDHLVISGAYGGFLLCQHLPGLFAPDVLLRPGQKQWLGGQMARIRRICNIDA